MLFMFVSYIHLSIITVSSLSHTDLMFSTATIFSVSSGVEVSVHMGLLDLFTMSVSSALLLYFVITDTSTFPTQPSVNTCFTIF